MLNVKALTALGTLAIVILGSFATGAAIVRVTRDTGANRDRAPAIRTEREISEPRAQRGERGDRAVDMPAAADTGMLGVQDNIGDPKSAASVDSLNDTPLDNQGAAPDQGAGQDGLLGPEAGWYDGGQGFGSGEGGNWEREGRERESEERERREREGFYGDYYGGEGFEGGYGGAGFEGGFGGEGFESGSRGRGERDD